jgi:hypothetical protein
MSETNPFLAARPYGPADTDRFFGREAATVHLTERIDLNRLVILMSPSGIGKTSLLRASIMPRLEKFGLSPVYLRPDPSGDADGAGALLDGRLGAAICTALLPAAARESESLRLLVESGAPDGPMPEVLDWFRALGPAHEVRRAILTPRSAPVEWTPQVGRYLAGSLKLEALAESWRRVDPELGDALDQGRSLNTLAGLFRSSQTTTACERAYERVIALAADHGRDCANRDSVVPMLRALATRPSEGGLLVRPDGDVELSPRIIVIIDQFEQVFTLSAVETRNRAFAMIAEIVAADLPLHLVLSLRKEWYADLVRHLSSDSAPGRLLDKASFHLEAMTRDEANEVMEKAPQSLGLDGIPGDQRETLWNALEVDGTIDAVVLSIACHELFASAAPTQSASEVNVDELLSAYLHRALSTFADPKDREEALDVLGEIVGTGATRGFTTQTQLLSAPLRDPARRRRVLEELQKRFLIKGDNPRRGADKIYDVMHERLLEPMRVLVAERPDLAALREVAARASERDAVRAGLDLRDCALLLGARERLALDGRVAGILLKSLTEQVDRIEDRALIRLRELSGFDDGEAAMDWWRTILAELSTTAVAAAPPTLGPRERLEGSWWMSSREVDLRLEQDPDRDRDLLALASAVRAPPSEANRGRLQALAGRLET